MKTVAATGREHKIPTTKLMYLKTQPEYHISSHLETNLNHFPTPPPIGQSITIQHKAQQIVTKRTRIAVFSLKARHTVTRRRNFYQLVVPNISALPDSLAPNYEPLSTSYTAKSNGKETLKTFNLDEPSRLNQGRYYRSVREYNTFHVYKNIRANEQIRATASTSSYFVRASPCSSDFVGDTDSRGYS